MNIRPVYCQIRSADSIKTEKKYVEFGRFINVKAVEMQPETCIKEVSGEPSSENNKEVITTSLKRYEEQKKETEIKYNTFLPIFGLPTIKGLISALKSQVERRDIPYLDIFSASVSPLDIITFQINKIFPGVIEEEKLNCLRESINKVRKTSDLDLASAEIKESIINLWTNGGSVNVFRYAKQSLNIFFRVLIENNKEFRGGYEYYYRQNELSMKQNSEFFFDPLLKNLSKIIEMTDKISFKNDNYRESNVKTLSIYSHLLTCIHKEEYLDYYMWGKLFAFLDLELLAIKMEMSITVDNTYIHEAIGLSGSSEASEEQVSEIINKMVEITGDEHIAEPFSFIQTSLSNACNLGRYYGFCSYIVSVLHVMLSRVDSSANKGTDDVLKLQAIRQFIDYLKYMKNLTHKQPLEASNIESKLTYLNEGLFNHTYKVVHSVQSKTFSEPVGLLKYLHASKKSLSISVADKSNPLDSHAISITPLRINGRYIHCYFDPNLGVKFLYNDEMILRHLKVSLFFISPSPEVCGINLGDYYYYTQEMNAFQDFLNNRNTTSNGEKYSDFINDINSRKLDQWKYVDSLVVNNEWDLIFPESKEFQASDSRLTHLYPERDNCFNSYEEWLQCFEQCMSTEKIKHVACKKEDTLSK